MEKKKKNLINGTIAGYGNIMRVETTGASGQTAQQDRLGYSGKRCSGETVEIHQTISICVYSVSMD